MNAEAIQAPSIGEQISSACKEKGWDLSRLATESGVPMKYLNRYKKGSVPGGENLAKLEQALGSKLFLQDGTNIKSKAPIKKPYPFDSQFQKTNWSFASDQTELTVNVGQSNFEITARHRGKEINIKLHFGLHISILSGNGDVFVIEPEQDQLRVSCRSNSLFASSGDGRNVMKLKQLE